VRRAARAALLAAGALAVAETTRAGRGRALDDRLFAWANSRGRPALDRVFTGVTELGSLYASLGAGATLALAGRRREATRAVAAATATWGLGQALKKAFRRPRPYETENPLRLLIARPRGTSWPSSHPAVLTTFVTVAARDLGLSSKGRGAVLGLGLAVAASRVYLGVHYPSDVVGGVLLGRAVADLVAE